MIKILLTDVDGVLTDGGMYYSAHGDVMKKFNAKDGMGINILRKKNIPTVIVTKEKTVIVKNSANKNYNDRFNNPYASKIVAIELFRTIAHMNE